MNKDLVPLVSYLASLIICQGVKPFVMYFKTGKFSLKHVTDSGGYPSAHSAGVASLAFAIGLKDGFDSSLFAIAFVLALIVIFDAMNVRWYAGENNRVTNKLVSDLHDQIDADDPIYRTKLKDVLGHKPPELVVGILLGIIISTVVYYIWR